MSSSQHRVASSEGNINNRLSQSPPDKGDARGLESLVKRIRERAKKIEGKIPLSPPLAKGERGGFNIDSEKVAFQREKSELEQADINIRTQCKQTEQRIKGLPLVIQQRQKAFERKYEKRYAQLKSKLDSINTAKTSTQFTARTRKLKAFLDKIKPPSRHSTFNPKKLPHRMAHPIRRLTFTKLDSPEEVQSATSSNGAGPVWRAPRMNYGRQHRVMDSNSLSLSPLAGESRREGSDGTSSLSLREAESDEAIPSLPLNIRGTEGSYDPALPDGLPAFVIPVKTGIQSPIRVAALGSVNGILSSAIVQTIPPPTAADLT